MTIHEVNVFLEGYNKRNRTSWEQTRIIAYSIIQTNSTKRLSPSDILSFDWDNAESKKTPATNPETLERLRQRAKKINNE